MRKFFINHMKAIMIITIIINLIIIIGDILSIDSSLFLLFCLLLFIILEFDIYIILINILNRKINKKSMIFLNTCNPDPLIDILKKELKIVDKKKNISNYEYYKFRLHKIEIFKYGFKKNVIDNFKSININNLSPLFKKEYKIQLALIYLHEKEYDKADILINSLNKEKDKEEIEFFNEIKILHSDKEKNQEDYFLEKLNRNENDFLLNKITYVRDLAHYYIKAKKYNNANLCINYMIEFGGNLDCVKQLKLKLEEINNTQSNDKINPKLNHLLFDTKPKTINTKNIILISMSVITLFLITYFFLSLVGNKTLYALSGDEFESYMNKNICKVHYKNEFNDINKVNYAYITDNTCKYTIGYINYEGENNKITPDEIAKYIEDKYNLVNPIFDRAFNNDPYDSVIYDGIYYAKIYRKDNTVIYIIANKKDKEEAINILKALRYDDKYPLKSLFN